MRYSKVLLTCSIIIIFTGLGFPQQNRLPANCTITFQARVFVQWGPDAIPPNRKFYIPISRRSFYLMDSDPAALLEKAALEDPGTQSYSGNNKRQPAGLGTYLTALDAKEEGFWGGTRYLEDFYRKAAKIIDPHILQRVETDREGKAVFAPVGPGTYFIVGRAVPRPEAWNLKVEANSSSIHLVLDGKNSLTAGVIDK